MKKSVIFCFSGTGNSLKAAKKIAEAIPECDIVSMGKNSSYNLESEYDSIGFVYPVYFAGIPVKVKEFVKNLNIKNNKNAYIFAVATCGGSLGNGVSMLNDILKEKGYNLSYGKKLLMFSNYVVLYNMGKDVKGKTEKSDKDIESIVSEIKNKKINESGSQNSLLTFYYNTVAKKVHGMDKNFNISNDCIGCGICKEVCPVENIELIENKPVFRHKCEQCMACIQFCPKRAINYKNKTQTRRRYTNPDISYKEFSDFNR